MQHAPAPSHAAVHAASLPAFAASYALLGGLGFYCGYPQLPPFLASTWFPDRRGLVVSVYMTAFGSGMLFAVPALQRLLAHFRSAPVRLGGIDEVALTLSEGGQRLALVDGVEREVVVATARDLTEAGVGSTLSEGVFLLGTGSNGVCEAMGANTVRLYAWRLKTRHMKFLDLADELGLVVSSAYEMGTAEDTPIFTYQEKAIALARLQRRLQADQVAVDSFDERVKANNAERDAFVQRAQEISCSRARRRPPLVSVGAQLLTPTALRAAALRFGRLSLHHSP